MRILMTTSWFPSRKHATLGNFVQRHIEAIALKHEVVVLACFRDSQAKGLEIEKTVENNVTIYRVYSAYPAWQFWKAKFAFDAGIQAIQKDSAHAFDLIHHHVIYPKGWLAARLAQHWNVPLVITEHWTIYNTAVRKDQPFGLKMLSKWTTRKASVICPVSQDLAETMKTYGLSGEYTVVPNVVDTSMFKIGDPEPGFHFLHISSLEDRHKNITGILHAWSGVCKKLQGAVLHIGGDGPYQDWRRKAEEMGIPVQSISFFGECTPAEVAKRMAESHCLVMFSRFENLPVVIVEAMASGLPVISSRVGGISEHIQRERGMLVQSENEEELQAAFVAMLTLWGDYNRFDIRRYAEAHFSREAVAERYHAVYTSALAQ